MVTILQNEDMIMIMLILENSGPNIGKQNSRNKFF